MSNRLEKIRAAMATKGLEGLLVWKAENRFYLSGFTGSAGMLFITLTEQYLITDFRYFNQAEEQASQYTLFPATKSIFASLKELFGKCNDVKKIGFEENFWTYAEFIKFKEECLEHAINWQPAGEIIAELRLIKDQEELQTIKKAVELTDEAFQHVMKQIKAGITEREVAVELEYYMRTRGASGPSFDYIVASGKRGAMPHGVATHKQIKAGELVTVDFGCVYQGYCSDMTRNFIFGDPDNKQKEVYELVLKGQLAAVLTITVGQRW
ncbi:MAG: Xaa-Pro peptidase family protein [Bacillota bacterium]|nr:Xaa-Pro peptidase family protein [Bacillota bacterium]